MYTKLKANDQDREHDRERQWVLLTDVNMSIKALRQKECKSQAEFKREITNLAFVKIRHFSPVGKLGFQIQHVEKKRLICV